MSYSSRPISVLLPSSTEPAVANLQDVHQKYPSFLRSSMAASLNLSSPRVAPRSVIRVVATSSMTFSTVSASDAHGGGQAGVADGPVPDPLGEHGLLGRAGRQTSWTPNSIPSRSNTSRSWA